jgi:hypothetical protein|nr:MAG TPA: Protein of unknown function (DUF4231) [Caudoviricetes sp.]
MQDHLKFKNRPPRVAPLSGLCVKSGDDTVSENIRDYDYIEQRLKEQMSYYSNSCQKLQRRYRILTFISIVITAIIPIFSLSVDDIGRPAQYIIAILGATASIISGITFFEKLRDKWILERATYEKLKSELAKFNAKAGQYKNLSEADSKAVFVETCESYMEIEHGEWRETMLKNDK